MRKAQYGDTVKVHFSVYHGNRIQFATTFGEEPMELAIGDGKLIECFEQSIVGMAEGEKKTVSFEPNQAMGERKPELLAKFSRIEIPEQSEDLEVGRKVEVEDSKGNTIFGTITQLSDQEVTVDANHPLAGKTLEFDIQLIEFVSD